MRSLSAVALLIAAGALGACYDKGPKSELQSRPPATGGMDAPAPGSQMPSPELSPAAPGASTQGQSQQ